MDNSVANVTLEKSWVHNNLIKSQISEKLQDSCSGEKSLRELDLNINLYQTLNYVTASEHLKYSARKLYAVLCVCGFCGA